MSNVDINVDRRTDGRTDGWMDGRTDGRTDGRKIGRLYRTLLQAGAIKMSFLAVKVSYLDLLTYPVQKQCKIRFFFFYKTIDSLPLFGVILYCTFSKHLYLLYNRVFNCFKQHVYYVSINSFIYYVSKSNFLEQHVYNNMMFTSLILDWVIFGMSWKI